MGRLGAFLFCRSFFPQSSLRLLRMDFFKDLDMALLKWSLLLRNRYGERFMRTHFDVFLVSKLLSNYILTLH